VQARCQTTFGGSAPPVASGGGRVEVPVVAARECSWTAASEASWLAVSPASGQGEAPLTLTITANTVPSTRSAAVVVNSQRLSVTQEAAPCQYEVSPRTHTVDPAAATVSVRVTTHANCAWTASGGEHWARLSTTSGSGEGNAGIRVEANTGGQRSAQFTVAGQQVTVTQQRFVPPAPQPPAPGPPGPSPAPQPPPTTPPPAPCSYALSPNEREFDRGGGTGSVSVSAASGCSWSASSNASWIVVVAGGGSGSGQVFYFVTRLTGNQDGRTGTISVAGSTHTVRQER
jgi:hypothetical protein